ncbi:MAG: Rieske 2Fe-2S domain-containing protein [Bacteroidota bacterium]
MRQFHSHEKKANTPDTHHGRVKNRRSFLAWILGGSFGAFAVSILYPIGRYLIPPASAEPKPVAVEAAKVDELATNSGKIFRFGNEPGILINTPEGELKAFTAICTHLACTVQYRADLQHIWCACHNGHYDLNGINIAGPPPRPLTPFKVNIRNDQVFASRES